MLIILHTHAQSKRLDTLFRILLFFYPLDKRQKNAYTVRMNTTLAITPIAYIQTDFPEKFGIPRQSGRATDLTAKIIFLPAFRSPDFFRGIEGFSHLWLLFDFSATRDKGYSATVRPPRLGGNERVGVFASRSPFRPNHIGLSCVKLIRVNVTADEVSLTVSGADLLDGTPILDVKPYLSFADCIENATGGYAKAHEHDCLQVQFPQPLLEKIPQEKRSGLLQCLADDPRPSYQDDERVYGMAFSHFQIKFTVQGDVLTVIEVV